MKRALYISAFVPDAEAPHAGGQAAHANLTRLREQYAHVEAIVCTTERGGTPGDMRIVQQTPRDFLRAAASHLGRSMPRLLAASIVHTRLNETFIGEIRHAIERTAPDLLFCDFTQSHLAGIVAAGQSRSQTELRLCVHDVFAQRCMRSDRSSERLMCGWVMREEWQLVTKADALLALCNKDADLLRSLYLAERVEVLPFRPPRWIDRVDVRARVPGRVLFFGNFDREENRESALWFTRECAPQVRQAKPGFHLVLGGNGGDRLLDDLGHHGWLSATGYIEDPAVEFSKASVCIAPLQRGAGVKFKVLEAIAASVPVLATPIAAEGIDRHPLLSVAPREAFGEQLIRFL